VALILWYLRSRQVRDYFGLAHAGE
jgi:hypothetical protein